MHLDEVPLPSVIFQKLCESNCVEDLTFRRGREETDSALAEETCKYIEQLLQSQTHLWHFALDCRVEEAGWQHIGDGIRANQSLQEVEVSIGSIHAAEKVGKGLAASKAIKKLIICGKYSAAEAVLRLLEELKHNNSFTDIVLKDVTWGDCTVLLGLQYLPATARVKLLNVKLANATEADLEGLKHCKSPELELSDSLDDRGVVPVMQGLAHNRHIKKLLITSKNGLLNNAAAAHYGPMLQLNEAITELTFASRIYPPYHASDFLINTGFSEMCKGLLSNKSLTKLDLSNCSIRYNLDVLGEVLMHNKTLEWIILEHNYFGDTDLVNFCEALKVNTTLKTLNLASCRLSRGAMLNFMKVIQANKTITDLNLLNHAPEFTTDMYPEFFKTLTANTTLKKVALGSNSYMHHHIFHEAFGLECIADLIRHNTTLSSLHLASETCRFTTKESVAALIEALKVNDTLTSLKTGVFWDNRVSLEQLNDLFSKNFSLREIDFCSHHAEQLFHTARNTEHRKRILANTMVLCENIFRSQEAMDLLPPELWMNIFTHLHYPGIGSMAEYIQMFVNYRNSKDQY